MDYTAIIGSLWAFCILVAFVLNKLNVWKNDTPSYDYLNFLGSALLITYAILLSSYPFIVLNTVWALVSLKDIFTRVFLKK